MYKITVDAGFSCPNLDGTLSSRGCAFCNNAAFSPAVRQRGLSVENQIEAGIEYGKRRYGAEKFIVYFQPYSNTHAPAGELEKKYNAVKKFSRVVGISIGTRPDCIDEEKIALIGGYASSGYEVWLEYGLQSVHDTTLQRLNRNHSYADFLKAVELTRKRKDIKICAHVIIGLPGETLRDIMETAGECRRLKLDGVKIHPLHVVKNTEMEKLFKEKKYAPLKFEEYVDAAALFMTKLHPSTVIQRLAAGCPQEFLVAPGWLNDKNRVLQAVEEKMAKCNMAQGAGA